MDLSGYLEDSNWQIIQILFKKLEGIFSLLITIIKMICYDNRLVKILL
jgi:hypothetical protein